MIKLMFVERQIREYAEYLYQRKKRYIISIPKAIDIDEIYTTLSLSFDVFPFGHLMKSNLVSIDSLVAMIKSELALNRDGYVYSQMVQFVTKGSKYLDSIDSTAYEISCKTDIIEKSITVAIEDYNIQKTKYFTSMSDLQSGIILKNACKDVVGQIVTEVARAMITQFLLNQEETNMTTEKAVVEKAQPVLTGIKKSPLDEVLDSIGYGFKGTPFGEKFVKGFVAQLVRASKVETETYTSGVEITTFKDFLGNKYIIPESLKGFTLTDYTERFFPTSDIIVLAFKAYHAEVTAYLNYALQFGEITTDVTTDQLNTVTHRRRVELATSTAGKHTHIARPITVDNTDEGYINDDLLNDALLDSIMNDIIAGTVKVAGSIKELISSLQKEHSGALQLTIENIVKLVDQIKTSITEKDGGLVLSIAVPDLKFNEEYAQLEETFVISNNLTQTTSNIKTLAELSMVIALDGILAEIYSDIARYKEASENQKTNVGKNKVTSEDIRALMDSMEYDIHVAYDKVTIVAARLPKNGFTFVGSSACVDPANFDREIGIRIAKKEIEDQLWLVEGYLLQNELFGKEK